MSLSLRELATNTWWPHSSKSRLTQGEWVPASMAIRIGASSEAKRRLKASGVVRSLPSSITSPLCWSMRHKGRSICRLCPIRLSPSVALCYYPWWADPPFHWASEPVEPLQTLKGYCVWGVGLLISSSENPVQAKFAEYPFHAL